MKKIICIFCILILFGAAIPAVNALSLKNDIVDETELTTTEDYEFYAGKMSIHPGDIWNGYSPDLDVDKNKNFAGKENVERSATITITADWEIEEDSAAFWDEDWTFTMEIMMTKWQHVNDWLDIGQFFTYKKIIHHETDEGEDEKEGKLSYSFDVPNEWKWFGPERVLQIYVYLKAEYERVEDYWFESGETGELKLKLTGNNPPDKPSRPDGPTQIDITDIKSGSIKYKTSTTDKENDLIKYGWDFNGDMEVDKWTDFHESGELVSVTFPKYIEETSWTIRVIAKDKYFGDLSEWSDPLSVSLPRSKDNQKQILPTFKYFNLLLQRFQTFSKNIIST